MNTTKSYNRKFTTQFEESELDLKSVRIICKQNNGALHVLLRTKDNQKSMGFVSQGWVQSALEALLLDAPLVAQLDRPLFVDYSLIKNGKNGALWNHTKPTPTVDVEPKEEPDEENPTKKRKLDVFLPVVDQPLFSDWIENDS